MGVHSHHPADIAAVPSRVLCALLICAALALLDAPATFAQQSVALTADIPAQPLEQALATFARQTGLQLVYVSDVISNQRSHAVPAGLSVDEALALLLQGTGLRSEYLTARSIHIVAGATPLAGATPAAKAAPRETAANTSAADRLDEVFITGSHLNQSAGETAAPLQIFTQEELSNGGVQTSRELLERISANQSFGGSNESVGLNGFTAASLRGLGSQRTLVLLNGQRLAPYALSGGQGVDLSGIPPSALDRVEVLKDGASAIYGTDAIGGVINFVLRHDYQGAEVNANYFATEHGGANNGRINATAGGGDLAKDQYNAFITVDYYKQQPLEASARDSTTTGYLPWLGLDYTSAYSFPANIAQPAGFGADRRNPTIPYPGGATAASCAPPLSFPTFDAPFHCQFDFAHLSDTIPEVDKVSVLAHITRQLDTQQQVFGEVSYYAGTYIQRIAPAIITNSITDPTPITLPPSSAFYPAAYVASLAGGNVSLPLELTYRTVELGPRIDRLTSELWRAVLGLRGDLGSWDYELTGNYTANRQVDRYVSGYPLQTSFAPLLALGVVNPFGPNTPAAVQQMQATQYIGWVNDNRAIDYGGAYRMTRRAWSAPGGPIALAFGVEGRREMLEQQSSDAYASGAIYSSSSGGVPSLPQAHRTVWAVYGEAGIPITKTLETDLALRLDDYSDFGSATDPKVSLRWQPLPTVTVRAAYGTGFRVPTLSDLYEPPQPGSTFNAFNDPVRCPVTHSDIDCGVNFLSHTGGNPKLSPEKSQQWGAGLIVGPLQGLMARLDYFQVEIRDAIDTMQADEIFSDYAFWAPTHVVRGPSQAPYPALPGPIDYVIENQINLGSISTSGIDADVRFAAPRTSLGQLTLWLTGTYTLDYSRGGIHTTLFPAGVGMRGPDGAIVRWRHYLTFDWSTGEWGTTLTQTFQDGYDEVDLLSCDPNSLNLSCSGKRRVSSYSLWDLQGRYRGLRNVTLALGVRNLFDASPPVSNQSHALQVGIDPTYADPRGRMYYLTLRYATK